MKFLQVNFKKIKVGNYICYSPSRTPTLKIYGIARKDAYGQLIVQSKNIIQDGTFHLKPKKPLRYYKTRLDAGKFQILID